MFPQFDPVIVQIGPFGIRWYALAYIAGLVLGWRLLRRLVLQPPAVATAVQADDFLTWATLGIVLGGRLGYVLFYQPGVYLAHPGMILAVWEGGMSFHGGALGVTVAILWFCRRNAIPLLGFADRVAVCVADRMASDGSPTRQRRTVGRPRRTGCPGRWPSIGVPPAIKASFTKLWWKARCCLW